MTLFFCSKRNQNGFGLTSALIGSVIIAVVSIGFMQLFQQLMSSQTLAKVSSQRDITHEEIRAVLSSDTACFNTFGSILMSNGSNVDVSSIKDSGSPPLEPYVVGGTHGNGALRISSMKFSYNDSGAGAIKGLGTLTVSYDSTTLSGAGANFRPQQMLISTEKNSVTNVLVKCIALARSTMLDASVRELQLWQVTVLLTNA